LFRYIVAFGLESGEVVVSRLEFSEDGEGSMERVAEFGSSCGLAVNSVKWRPVDDGRDREGVYQLATCGDDWSVRLFDVSI
jgi:hypothetical protein